MVIHRVRDEPELSDWGRASRLHSTGYTGYTYGTPEHEQSCWVTWRRRTTPRGWPAVRGYAPAAGYTLTGCTNGVGTTHRHRSILHVSGTTMLGDVASHDATWQARPYVEYAPGRRLRGVPIGKVSATIGRATLASYGDSVAHSTVLLAGYYHSSTQSASGRGKGNF